MRGTAALNGFSNIQWFGKSGGDKGRDLMALRVEEPLSGVRLQKKWLVQCRRYISKRLLKVDIEGFLVSAKEHNPQVALLVISSTLTPDVRDWLNAVQKDYRFEILLWEELDLEREIRLHRDKLTLTLLPPLRRQAGDAVLFYRMSEYTRSYMCNEIHDIGFYVMNPGTRAHDIQRIQGFIEYIRNNDVVFEEPREGDEGTD